MSDRAMIRFCNVGVFLGCVAIATAIRDYRDPAFVVACVCAGWFLRATIMEW